MKRGFEILRDKKLYRSIAFTRKERKKYGLEGLLPDAVAPEDELMRRYLESLRRLPGNLDRYISLSSLQERNESLFYRTIIHNIEELLPVIYTPTVGEACKEYSHISREPKGFFITPRDTGHVYRLLGNWPNKDVRVIVVTDGQRILGLGDLGANGMGIPIGKLALYTACAGIPPEQCLPVVIDVGSNNTELLNDILYLGYPHKRVHGKKYYELVEEFVMAVQRRYPKALIQFEDFLTPNAYGLLNRYRQRILCFNDDIQGTAAVALAGVYASTRVTGKPFREMKILFLGAGSAATGIADLLTEAFMAEGTPREEALKHLWFADINGLVVKSRKDLLPHNLPYAHEMESLSFADAVEILKPDILIGATGAPGTFTQQIISRMAAHHERPVIFALSNPTSRAECTAEEAYAWSEGRAVFVSGSPFGTVEMAGRKFRPGQGNNAYVFPGIGLGATFCQAKSIPESFFLDAARTLARMVSEEDLRQGSLYPPLREIRNISLEIAMAVCRKAYGMGIARKRKPAQLKSAIRRYMYNP